MTVEGYSLFRSRTEYRMYLGDASYHYQAACEALDVVKRAPDSTSHVEPTKW